MKISPFFKNLILAFPLYLLSILPFVYITDYFGFEIQLKSLFFGALGWWLALLLRIPFILYVKAKNIKSNRLIVGASGPTEEITRLVILFFIGLNVNSAFSFGLGWAMIEIIYGLIQVVGIGILEQRTDEKAQEAKALMQQMGMDKTFSTTTPFWGALERFSANGIHIGFTLLLLLSPYVIIFTIPIHSLINFYVVKMNKISIAKSQSGLLLIGCLVFLIGLLSFFNLTG